MPGRHLVKSSLDLSSCELCPVDTFKDSLGNSACTQCPPHTAGPAGSSSSVECQCVPEFGIQDAQVAGQPQSCEACIAGKYKPGTGNRACFKCPPNSMSPPGSNDVTACTCLPGHSGPAGGPAAPAAWASTEAALTPSASNALRTRTPRQQSRRVRPTAWALRDSWWKWCQPFYRD